MTELSRDNLRDFLDFNIGIDLKWERVSNQDIRCHLPPPPPPPHTHTHTHTRTHTTPTPTLSYSLSPIPHSPSTWHLPVVPRIILNFTNAVFFSKHFSHPGNSDFIIIFVKKIDPRLSPSLFILKTFYSPLLLYAQFDSVCQLVDPDRNGFVSAPAMVRALQRLTPLADRMPHAPAQTLALQLITVCTNTLVSQ